MESTKNILEFKNITKKYAGVVALDNVSLAFRAGEVHALAGENGAGKSTLIKSTTGAVIPTSGTILIDGKEYLAQDCGGAIKGNKIDIFSEYPKQERYQVEIYIKREK